MPPFLARSSTFAAIVERKHFARSSGVTRSSKENVIRKSKLGRSRREGLRLVREGAKEDVSGEKGVLGQVSATTIEQ